MLHSLQQAILKPLLKKASLDHEILSNFRPISNLKFVAKLTGKVVANRLVSYLEQNHLDEPLQSTYKKFHSCETALVRVQNDMLCAIDKRCCVALLLLDWSAAFDTVDHNILRRLHSTKDGFPLSRIFMHEHVRKLLIAFTCVNEIETSHKISRVLRVNAKVKPRLSWNFYAPMRT